MRTFDEMWDIASKIDGRLTKEEARDLWHRSATASGDVVVLGCEYGQASVLLAGSGPIICADKFNRGACHQDQYFVWRKNILDSGVAGNIEMLQEDHSYHTWESPVGLLYVDMPSGDATMRQLLGWEVHMPQGATLAVHGRATPPKSFRIERMLGGLTIYRKYERTTHDA